MCKAVKQKYSAHLKAANLCDDLCQAWVAHDQPAAGRDPVSLVLELLGVDVVKVLEARRKKREALRSPLKVS